MAIDRTAASLDLVDVQAAYNGTGIWAGQGIIDHGDTLRLPAGSVVWTTGPFAVTRNIKLIGATTITFGAKVNDKASISFTINGSPTTIRSQGAQAMTFDYPDNAFNPLIQGIVFDGNDNLDNHGAAAVMVAIGGRNKNIRVTQCHFKYQDGFSIKFNAGTSSRQVCGVMDHCVHQQNSSGEKVTVRHDAYQPADSPGTYVQGDGSFMDGPHYGDSTKAMYFEDCIFLSYDKDTGQFGEKHGGLDMEGAGRRVVRHSYLVGVPTAAHGTETGGYRGARMQENYANILDYRDTIGSIVGTQVRAGTFLVWDCDVWARTDFEGWIAMAYRQTGNFTNRYRAAYGEFPLDANATITSTETNFVYVPGAASKDFWDGWGGTVDGTGLLTATLSQAPPTPPAAGWGHFVMRNIATDKQLQINTIVGTAVTFYTGLSADANAFFPPGSQIKVHRIVDSLDQATAGKSDRINSGLDPATNVDFPGEWPHQRTEPHYAWKNTIVRSNTIPVQDYSAPGGPYTDALVAQAATPTLAENTHVFNQVGGIQTSATSPFNGSVGTGFGLLSRRPTTFTYNGAGAQPQEDPTMPNIDVVPGVAYWATDESKLYVATANNTWTLYYEPEVYPHPLVETPTDTKIISLSGPGLIFGNVIIGGTPPVANLNCANNGDTILTVASVASNNGKFVLSSTAGFTVDPGDSHDLTVTYTPTTETTDNCTITFDSDATGGSETIAASGTGVPPVGGGHGKGKKKGVLARRT